MEFENITLRDISWIVGCVDNGMDGGLIESISEHDLDVFETIIETVAATPEEKTDFRYNSFKKRIAGYRKELAEWEAEKASWED